MIAIGVACVLGLLLWAAQQVLEVDDPTSEPSDDSPTVTSEGPDFTLHEHQTMALDETGLVVDLSDSEDVSIELWGARSAEPVPFEYVMDDDWLIVADESDASDDGWLWIREDGESSLLDVSRDRDGTLASRAQTRYWADRIELTWRAHPERAWTISTNGSEPQPLAGPSFTDLERGAHSRYVFVGDLPLAMAMAVGEATSATHIYAPLSTSALRIPDSGPPVRIRNADQ